MMMMEKLPRNRPNINALRLSAMHGQARLDGNEDVSNIMSGEETHGCCGSSNNLQAIFLRKLTTQKLCDSTEIALIPVLSDNYSYLLMDHRSRKGIVVDPADAVKISEVAEQYNIDIVAIPNTHKHDDHVCGNVDLQRIACKLSVAQLKCQFTDPTILDGRQGVRMSSKAGIS